MEIFVNKHYAIDAFAGAGGLTVGLEQAGFESRLGFDLDQAAAATYSRNIEAKGIQADASALTGAELLAEAGLGGSECSLLAGGPPCQGFSKQNRTAHAGDQRNQLVLEFLRLVNEIQPKSFLMENVPMMAQVRGEQLLAEFEHLADYELTGHFYVAADYGVAQTRQRYVLVGIRSDAAGSFVVPDPTTPERPTVREAIGDIPTPPPDGTPHADFLNHYTSKPSALNIERFSHVPQGGGWQDIPFELRLPCHQRTDTASGGWPDVYGRLDWDAQCPTITGGFDSFTRGRYGHPEENRAITPREAARLQGFPDGFEFLGNRHEVRHQIGNAVPPPLASAIGRAILRAFSGESPKQSRFAQQGLL